MNSQPQTVEHFAILAAADVVPPSWYRALMDEQLIRLDQLCADRSTKNQAIDWARSLQRQPGLSMSFGEALKFVADHIAAGRPIGSKVVAHDDNATGR